MSNYVCKVTSAELNKISVLKKQSSSDHIYTNVKPPAEAFESSLVFVSTAEMARTALSKNVKGFIILEKNYSMMSDLFSAEHDVWTTPQINQAMSQVLQLFDLKKNLFSSGIHTTAVISPTAKIGRDVYIGPYAVVQDHATIGDNVSIGSHCSIGHAAQIGANSILAPHVVIGAFCEVGQRCQFSSFADIGGDGFGFYTDRTNTHHKIPQIGKVVIEDDCEIQSHTAVDRATLTETRIKKGSKLDNYCHIAHNVELGENAILAAGFVTAGSTKFGKNLTSGGGVHVNGHIHIADNVNFAGRTGVTSTIDQAGVYGGFPHQPLKDSLKVLATLPHLPKLRKKIALILKHLNLNED